MPFKYAPRVFLAGLAATLVMTLVTFPIWSALNLASMDFASIISSELGGTAAQVGSKAWWMGMAEHFFNGAVLFPGIYAFVLYKILPGVSARKGAWWGFFLWLGWQAVIMPLVGMGFFSSRSPLPVFSLFISLNGHLIYGVLFGLLVGHPTGVKQAMPDYEQIRESQAA